MSSKLSSKYHLFCACYAMRIYSPAEYTSLVCCTTKLYPIQLEALQNFHKAFLCVKSLKTARRQFCLVVFKDLLKRHLGYVFFETHCKFYTIWDSERDKKSFSSAKMNFLSVKISSYCFKCYKQDWKVYQNNSKSTCENCTLYLNEGHDESTFQR